MSDISEPRSGSIGVLPSKRVLACQRCRDRKQKCDNGRPKCGHCAHANRDCVPQRKARNSPYSAIDSEALVRRLASVEEKLRRQDERNAGDQDDDRAAVAPRGALDPVSSSASTPRITPPLEDAKEPLELLSSDDVLAWYDMYMQYVHPQYPFLSGARLKRLFSRWVAGRAKSSSSSSSAGLNNFDECIVYLVLSTGALMYESNPRRRPSHSDLLYDHAEKAPHLLPRVLSSSSLVQRTTALLLIVMRDLHGASSDAIIQHTSAAIRTAITAGLHRRTPPSARGAAPEDALADQMRRRMWWTCYGLDRLVAMVYGHPVSISDNSITIEMFDMNNGAGNTGKETELEGSDDDEEDDVSTAFHLTRGRKIYSRIIETFSDPNLLTGCSPAANTPSSLVPPVDPDRLRARFCQELEEWQNAIPEPPQSIPSSSSATVTSSSSGRRARTAPDRPPAPAPGRNWFRMVAYYAVLGLVSGYLHGDVSTRQVVASSSTTTSPAAAAGTANMTSSGGSSSSSNINNPAPPPATGVGVGDTSPRAVVACCNACITFQLVFRSRQMAPTWLAVLTQFQAGVTVLYCFFWATPEQRATEAWYADPAYAARGVGACSSTLAVLAERWREAEVYRDAFDLLCKAVPLLTVGGGGGGGGRRTSKGEDALSKAEVGMLGALAREIRVLGAHFRAVDMVDEIFEAHHERLKARQLEQEQSERRQQQQPEGMQASQTSHPVGQEGRAEFYESSNGNAVPQDAGPWIPATAAKPMLYPVGPAQTTEQQQPPQQDQQMADGGVQQSHDFFTFGGGVEADDNTWYDANGNRQSFSALMLESYNQNVQYPRIGDLWSDTSGLF